MPEVEKSDHKVKDISENDSTNPAPPAQRELPPFTLKNVLLDLVNGTHALIFDPECNKIIIPIILFLESILTKIIINNVAYTEIDYTAYMEQIDLINGGELDYANIFGGTGPLVYPAGHVLIYRILSVLTKGTENVRAGQTIFGYLYTFTQLLAFLVFANLELPPWCFYLLCLSKRLHSIYVLRLFNDCFATLFAILMVLSFQYSISFKSYRTVSTILKNYVAPWFYSVSISIKMNSLLYLPAVLIALYFLNDENLLATIPSVLVMISWQFIIALPFLTNGDGIRSSYLANAFDFKRKFMFKWTVNWRFLGAEAFNCDIFHKLLLLTHIVVLLVFLFIKFLTPKLTGKSYIQLFKDGFQLTESTITPSNIIRTNKATKYITYLLTIINFIGVIFARSLHYQFLSWYAWSYPILLNAVFGNGVIGFALSFITWVTHEWCWNVYPSTELSSAVLLALNSSVLVGCWLRLNFDGAVVENEEKDVDENKKEK